MPLRIAITGSSGMAGSAISLALRKEGHNVIPLVRPTTPLKTNKKVIRWDYERETIDAENLENLNVVIHLAGASIAGQRWTPAYKYVIRHSRFKGTAFLAKTLALLKKPPQLFLSASAVGYYGHDVKGDKKDESSAKGNDFLAQVCDEWESAAQSAKRAGIRVVTLRMGMILSRRGGALDKMLPVFKLGLGGNIGSGSQMVSWVALNEIPLIIRHIMEHRELNGAVNCVSPRAVTNAEFTQTLGKVLRRPTVFPLPAFAAKLMFGEMADSLLLGGAEIIPGKLAESGYRFRYPELETALQEILLKNT